MIHSSSFQGNPTSQVPQDHKKEEVKSPPPRQEETRTEEQVKTLGIRSESPVICSKSVNGELQLVKRLRGGAGGAPKLPELAVRLAARILPTGFCIQPGRPNPAQGNCLIYVSYSFRQ